MMNIPLLISILLFITIVLFSVGIFVYINYRKGHVQLIKRINQIGEGMQPEREEKKNGFYIIRDHFIKIMSLLGDRVKPKSEGEISHLRKSFLKAGYRRENAPVIFFGVKALLAILLPIIFSLMKLLILKPMTPIRFMFLSILMSAIGFYLPTLWLRMRTTRRKEKILEGFPDALDLMVVCVEAGTGLDAAIYRVGEEMKTGNKVLSDEFRLLSLELRAGKQRQDALRSLAHRTDLEDVNSLVTLLVQTERFGTSIGQALRVHSDAMRTRRYQRAEEAAAKLPVKLLLPLILFIFPSLFVVIMGPGVIRIIRTLLPGMAGQ